MKFKSTILLSLFFLVFLAATSVCINWGDPSLDADEMISSGEEIVVGSPEMTPWESRALQKNKSSLDWNMPSTLTGSGKGPRETRALGQSSEASMPAEEAASAQNNASDAVDVQGNWFFTLNDSVIRNLALALFQDGKDIYGTGKIKEGNSSMDVAVSGTASGSDIELNLVSSNPILHYKLNLTLMQERAAGDYQASSASGESWTGRAEGQKT